MKYTLLSYSTIRDFTERKRAEVVPLDLGKIEADRIHLALGNFTPKFKGSVVVRFNFVNQEVNLLPSF